MPSCSWRSLKKFISTCQQPHRFLCSKYMSMVYNHIKRLGNQIFPTDEQLLTSQFVATSSTAADSQDNFWPHNPRQLPLTKNRKMSSCLLEYKKSMVQTKCANSHRVMAMVWKEMWISEWFPYFRSLMPEKNQLLLSMTNVIGKLLNPQAKRTQNEIAKKPGFPTGLWIFLSQGGTQLMASTTSSSSTPNCLQCLYL